MGNRGRRSKPCRAGAVDSDYGEDRAGGLSRVLRKCSGCDRRKRLTERYGRGWVQGDTAAGDGSPEQLRGQDLAGCILGPPPLLFAQSIQKISLSLVLHLRLGFNPQRETG